MTSERHPIFYPMEMVPAETWRKVAFFLDQPISPNWRTLISQMPTAFYTASQVEEFAMQTLKLNGSPTLALLKDLKQRQVSLHSLVDWLKDIADDGSVIYRVLSILVPFMGDSFGRPNIVQEPEDQFITVGMPLALSCEAAGQAPLNYQWFRGKESLLGETSNKLSINVAQEQHEGLYICRVSNALACVFTRWAKVQVTPSIFPADMNSPVIIMHPKSCALYCDEELKLYCDAVGNPPPALQWYHNDSPIKGATEREFVIENVKECHDGRYNCRASNPFGAIDSMTSEVTILQEKVPPSPAPNPRGADVTRSYRAQSLGSNKPTSKIALAIGNQAYVNAADLGELVHPRNDVRDVAGVLSSVGFKVVTLVDLTLSEMKDAIELFCQILEKDMYVVFYFAGHGFEVNSESYLMPIDATKEYNRAENISVSYVLQAITELRTKLNLLLLDCCRTTPQECVVDPIPKLQEQLKVQHTNTVICFGCCSQARVLECPAESNGFFAGQLVKHLGKQKKIDDVLFDVAQGIHREAILDPNTGQRQIVYRLSTLVEELSLCDETLPGYTSRGLELWQEAHSMPQSPVTVFENQYVKVNLALVPEFSNVLLIHSNIVTASAVSHYYVHFLVPSKVGGATVELLPSAKGQKKPKDETVRLSALQRYDGELDVHVEVGYEVNGISNRGRAVYSLQGRPLYAKITDCGKHSKSS